MQGKWGKLSPALNRFVLLSLLLTLAAQIVLVYVGLAYARSIDKSMTAKRTGAVLNQFGQNVLYQLNNVNNLLLLFQTPDFSDFFRNRMSLRDEEALSEEKEKLQHRMTGLYLSPDLVESVYFIGADRNEVSYRFVTGSSRFEELPRLRMDVLQYAKLDGMFLENHDQFVKYTSVDFSQRFRTDYELLTPEHIAETRTFISHLNSRLIQTNGNENGVLIVLVMNDKFFQHALPENKIGEAGSIFSVIDRNNRLLWSSAMKNQPPGGESYVSAYKEIHPYDIRTVYAEKEAAADHFQSGLLLKMAGLALLTLFVTLFTSVLYLKKVFKPFRIISMRLKSQSLTSELSLRRLPADLIEGSFHSISLRRKLIILLLAAVSIPSISDGVLYSRFLNQEVAGKMSSSVDEIGRFSVTSILNRTRFMNQVANEIAVSRGFQNYITFGYELKDLVTNLSGITNILNLSAFPGLNEVAYFVLLDQNGTCIYSSIYSNNKDIFNTDSKYLLHRDDAYWISDFKDVYNHISTAVLKRMEQSNETFPATYLLLVPKESLFETIQSGTVNASYSILDREGHSIYRSEAATDANPAGKLYFTGEIPDTNWKISIEYAFNDVVEKTRVYQEQYLLSLLIVLFVSIAAALAIANVLTKPIKELNETMFAVGAGDLSRRVGYDKDNEIGDIIRSYNRMVDHLDRTIRQNMSIMEENAQTKIREKELISMKTRAELQMLQAQINPHFLYNTLEAINMRGMKSGNHEISAIVSSLADLFRYSIAKGSDVALLEQELKHACNYLTIQQIRYGHSFELEIDVPETFRKASVVRFILQPLIENAIKHGFPGWESGGLIRIAASASDGLMRLSVSDNGIGMNKQKLSQLNADMESGLGDKNAEQSGIGLKNVYYRLKLVYQEELSMTIDSEWMGGTVIRIEFPLGYADTPK